MDAVRPWRSPATAAGGSRASTGIDHRAAWVASHGGRSPHAAIICLIKASVVRGVEKTAAASPSPSLAPRMRRIAIEMRAGHPALGHRFGRGWVRRLCSSLGHANGCAALPGSCPTAADRLIDLDAAERLMKTRCGLADKDHAHAGLPGSNMARPACSRSRACEGSRDPDAESPPAARRGRDQQDGIRGLPGRGARIGADFGQACAGSWRNPGGKAQRDPLISSLFGDASEAKARWCVDGLHGLAAAAVTARNGSTDWQPHRLVVVAREFGDGAEGAEAPMRFGIGYFPLQQIDRARSSSPEGRYQA
jgi:hypothetical protein